MTYVTGQPIIFVGCGQVRCSQLFLLTLSFCFYFLRRRTQISGNCELQMSFKRF